MSARHTLAGTTALTELPDVFLLYQQELWEAVEHWKVVLVEKSRRTGYSWALAAISAAQASTTRADRGSDVLYMGYEKDMTREFAYSDDCSHRFRLKPATCSDRSQPGIPMIPAG